MTDYINIPTLPSQDLLHGVEAVSPYPRIHPRKPQQDSYQRQSANAEKDQTKRAPRRFSLLRELINELQKLAEIHKLDYATTEAEVLQLGLMVVEDDLIPQLLQLKIPLKSIEELQTQMEENLASISLGRGRIINDTDFSLFPVSTAGLYEYILKLDHLLLRPGASDRSIADRVEQDGLYTRQLRRLRLTFSRNPSAQPAFHAPLSLRIVVVVGVMEQEEDGRRAIVFPLADKSYGLYADKMIDLSI